MTLSRAIVLLAYGKRGPKLLSFVHSQWKIYAKNCGAELFIITGSLDPSVAHFSMAQKLLIPYEFRAFDLVLYSDLDVLISPNAKNIFLNLSDADFHAVPVDLKSQEYSNTCKTFFDIVPDTSHQDVFERFGLFVRKDCAHFNDGVWLCRPNIVAELFKKSYFEHKSLHQFHNAGELLMGYTICHHLSFDALDYRFNSQPLFMLYGNDTYEDLRSSFSFRAARYLERKYLLSVLRYPAMYDLLISSFLEDSWFVHFAGGLPYIQYAF